MVIQMLLQLLSHQEDQVFERLVVQGVVVQEVYSQEENLKWDYVGETNFQQPLRPLLHLL